MLRFLLYTSLFAAACALGLCLATEHWLLGHWPLLLTPMHGLAVGGTLLVYNVHYLIRRTAQSDRAGWTDSNRIWNQSIAVAGLLACALSVWHMPVQVFEWYVLLALLSFAYSIPMLPWKGLKRIRDFGLVKIFTLTAVWTIVTTVFPMLYWHRAPDQYPLEIALRFVFIFVLCVAFDIRDMQTDLEAGIHTLPNRIGLLASYRLIAGSLMLFCILAFIQHLRYPSLPRLAGAVLAALYAWWAIGYVRKHPSDYGYLLYVDGAMLIYAILTLA